MRLARRSAAPCWAVQDRTNAYCLAAGKTCKTKVRHAPSRRTTTDVPRSWVGSPSLKRAEASTTAISEPRERIFSTVIVARRVAGALAHAASIVRRIASCPELLGPSTSVAVFGLPTHSGLVQACDKPANASASCIVSEFLQQIHSSRVSSNQYTRAV